MRDLGDDSFVAQDRKWLIVLTIQVLSIPGQPDTRVDRVEHSVLHPDNRRHGPSSTNLRGRGDSLLNPVGSVLDEFPTDVSNHNLLSLWGPRH